MLDAAGVVVIVFFVLFNSATAALLIRAMPTLWRHWDLADELELEPVLASGALPTVSVLVTGAADRATTVDGLRSLLSLRYPRHEVVLVHDGAASGNLAALIEAFDLYQVPPAVLVNVPTGPVRGYYRSRRHGKLFVIDKEDVGRADGLNAALNASRFPYVLTMDASMWLEADAIQRLMRPFLLGERVAAVAATVRIARDRAADEGRARDRRVPAGWLPGVQAVERLRDNAFVRIGWTSLGGQLPGAGGVLLHRRDHLLEIDGYRTIAIDEELDLTARLRHHLRAQQLSDAIPVLPDVVAWTIAPASAAIARERRDHLFRGELQVLRFSRRSLFSPRQGVARLLPPAHLAISALVAPVMELIGYGLLLVFLVTRGASTPFIPLFVVALFGYAGLLTLWALVLEAVSARAFRSWRDMMPLALFAAAEQVGFRQVMLWCRLRAAWSAVRGGHSGDSDRQGDLAEVHDAPAVADEAATR